MGECCPAGSIGPLAPPKGYVPKGEMIILEPSKGKCYYVAPSDSASTKAIVMCPDIFGIDSGRTKFLADKYAEQGYHVGLVHSFNEGSLDESKLSFSRIFCLIFAPSTWSFFRRNSWVNIKKYYDDTFGYLEQIKGCSSFGLVGFCWGSYPQTMLASRAEVKASVYFHPSISYILPRSETKSWQDIVKASVKCPIMLLASKNEPGAFKPAGEMEKIISSLDSAKGSVFEAYEKSAHGFVNRGDMLNEETKKDVEDAYSKSVVFLKQFV